MRDLLESVLNASGGMARWNRIKEIVVEGEMGGMILDVKSDFDCNPVRVATVSANEVGLTVYPYLDEDTRGVLTQDYVRTESKDGKTIKKERRHPRDRFLRFPGSLRRFFWWDALDVLYFAGYSIWNYFNTPFMFAGEGFESEEIAPWRSETGEEFRRLKVTFPTGFHTHGREQIFYVHTDPPNEGLIHHFEYVAEVLGPWARAIHFTDKFMDFDGIKFPIRRRALIRDDVFLRNWRKRWFPRSMAMWGDIDRITFKTVDAQKSFSLAPLKTAASAVAPGGRKWLSAIPERTVLEPAVAARSPAS